MHNNTTSKVVGKVVSWLSQVEETSVQLVFHFIKGTEVKPSELHRWALYAGVAGATGLLLGFVGAGIKFVLMPLAIFLAVIFLCGFAITIGVYAIQCLIKWCFDRKHKTKTEDWRVDPEAEARALEEEIALEEELSPEQAIPEDKADA